MDSLELERIYNGHICRIFLCGYYKGVGAIKNRTLHNPGADIILTIMFYLREHQMFADDMNEPRVLVINNQVFKLVDFTAIDNFVREFDASKPHDFYLEAITPRAINRAVVRHVPQNWQKEQRAKEDKANKELYSAIDELRTVIKSIGTMPEPYNFRKLEFELAWLMNAIDKALCIVPFNSV